MADFMDFDGYKIVRQAIARGSAGVVHEAISPDGERVAIKVLNKEAIEESVARRLSLVARSEPMRVRWAPSVAGEDASSSDTEEIDITEETRRVYEKNVERFKEEYRIIVGLKHPNVAEVRKIGFFDGHLYFVSEFIAGKPIAEHVRGWKPADMTKLFLQALEGLDFIHKNGLIHLDIKSQNVLVHEVDGVARVKIIDFGMAMTPAEYDGKFMGTPSYIAPEVALGKRELVDARSDLFSFGVLMYHCITWGAMPFARPKGDVEKLRRDLEHRIVPDPPSHAHSKYTAEVPKHFDTIVMRLIAHDPKDRFYGSARAVMNALLTGMADAFAGAPDTRSLYIRPAGDRHIGRDAEQAKMGDWVRGIIETQNAQPPVVAIRGGYGMGKSHFLRKIRESAERHVESLFISHAKFPSDETWCDDWVAALEKHLLQNSKPAVVLVDDLHELCTLLEREPENPVWKRAAAVIGRISAFSASRREKPSLFGGTMPVFMCLAFDGGGKAANEIAEKFRLPKNFTEDVELKAFTPSELAQYLKSTPALGGVNLPAEWIEFLHKNTRGIPGLVKEHLESIDSRGLLFDLGGKIVMKPSIAPPSAPPPTMREYLRGLLNGLDPDERRILEVMAVWDMKHMAPPAAHDDLSRLVQLDLLKHKIQGLAQKEILVQDGARGGYSFVCRDYFPAFIYGLMDLKDRRHWHDRIRYHLTSRGVGGDVALLHASFGASERDALKASLKLGRRFFARKGDARSACDFFRQGLMLAGERPKLFAAFAVQAMDANQQIGNYAAAQELYERASSLLRGGRGERAWQVVLVIKRVGLAIQQRKFDETSRLFEKARGLMPRKTPVRLHLTLSNFAAKERYEKALASDGAQRAALFEEAKNLYLANASAAEKMRSARGEKIQNNNLGIVLLSIGDYSAAILELEKKLALHQEAGDLLGILFSTIFLADANRLAGRFDTALALARDAVAAAKETREGAWLWRAHHMLANVLHDANRFEEALAENTICFASSAFLEDAGEHRRTRAAIWVQKGHCYKELRRFEDAVAHFQAALELNPEPFMAMSAHEGIGESFFGQGNFPESIQHFDVAQKLLDAMPKDSAPTYRDSVRKFRNLAVESMKSSSQ